VCGYTVEAVLKKLVKNAAIVAVGGIAAKVLGAIYRIPLTNILGAEGIGLYQMVFPFYCILLTLSSTGIPSAIAKLTAEEKGGVLKRSLAIFGVIGLIGGLIMFFGADTLAAWQGNSEAAAAYRTLAPSVPLTTILSCFRGYWQGKLNMKPTAVSQVIEQVIKLAAGLFLCTFFGKTAEEKAALAALAVSLSEVGAVVYMLLLKRGDGTAEVKTSYKTLLLTAAPITLTTLAIPLSRAVDSFTAIRLIGGDASVATASFGLFSGVVESISSLPVAVCYSLAVSGLPLVAKGEGNAAKQVLIYTLALSTVFAAGTYILSRPIITFLYPRLSAEQTDLCVSMLKISALSVVGAALVQSFTAIFIGKGKTYVAALNMFAGVGAKAAAVFLLVPRVSVGVYGYGISDIICYFVATICFLLYSIKEQTFISRKRTNGADDSGPWRGKRRSFRKGV